MCIVYTWGLMDYIRITKENKIVKGWQFITIKVENEKDKNKNPVEHEVTGIYEKEVVAEEGKVCKKEKKRYSMYLIFNDKSKHLPIMENELNEKVLADKWMEVLTSLGHY